MRDLGGGGVLLVAGARSERTTCGMAALGFWERKSRWICNVSGDSNGLFVMEGPNNNSKTAQSHSSQSGLDLVTKRLKLSWLRLPDSTHSLHHTTLDQVVI